MMGIKDKIDAYKKERAKLKAIEKSAYSGQKKITDQKKAVQKAEKAAEKGIAKAKAGGTWGFVAKAARKEAAKWELGDGKTEPIIKKKNTTTKKTISSKEIPPQTKKFDGKPFKIIGQESSKNKAETLSKRMSKAGYKVRTIKTTKWGYLIYRRK